MSDKKRKITPRGEKIIRYGDETAGTTGINAADSCDMISSANDYRELLCKLKEIALTLGSPLYIVGGAVRDFVFSKEYSSDIDLASPADFELFNAALKKCGIVSAALYRRTHTVQFEFDGKKCEFTSFRKERYADGGGHTPEFTEPTDDIYEDARRRDFKCNAVYYDVIEGEFVDPLGGIEDIKNKILDTVKTPDDVFKSDGLRLMRLARFTGELGFTPTEEVIESAKKYSGNLKDISAERIYAELVSIINPDKKHGFSPTDGFYRAVEVLYKTGVMKYVFPYFDDISLRTCFFAGKSIRLYALPVGERDGVKARFLSLKSPVRVAETAERVVETLPKFMDGNNEKEAEELKIFVLKNSDIIDKIIALKSAYAEATEDKRYADSAERIKKIYKNAADKNLPKSLKELKINGTDLKKSGITGGDIGAALETVFNLVATEKLPNEKERLLSYVCGEKSL